MQRAFLHLLNGLLLITLALPAQADETTVELPSGQEITLQSFGHGVDRILWLPSEFGFRGERGFQLAGRLAETKTEVWVADLHSDYFISPGRSSLTEIPLEDVAQLIAEALPETGKLYLMSTGRGAALSLMAARQWQLEHSPSNRLGGLVLLHPNLHAKAPQPGEPAQYLPVTSLSNLPIYILQPANSAKQWYLPELRSLLEQGGSTVFSQVLDGVSDGFHLRDDFTEYEAVVSEKLPAILARSIQLLRSANNLPRTAFRPTIDTKVEWSGNAFKESLQPYPGTPLAPELVKVDVQNLSYDLSEERGRTVLLNFWASWCPPCVKEIPSLGRLQQKFDKEKFKVLSIDVGESKEIVEQFLKKVPAEFPVLLDPEGETMEAWNIRAFPTTFILNREGRIQYAYFGALEWDDDQVVELIDSLIEQ